MFVSSFVPIVSSEETKIGTSQSVTKYHNQFETVLSRCLCMYIYNAGDK